MARPAVSVTYATDFQSGTSTGAVALAESLLALNSGLTLVNTATNKPFISGNPNCAGFFKGGKTMVPDNVRQPPQLPTDFPDEGVILSSGDVSFLPIQNSDEESEPWNTAGDAQLSNEIKGKTFDACVLQFDFTCNDQSVDCIVGFDYVWGSDEYTECKSRPSRIAWL